ncbi:MAG: enoyl-CoA hydratase-related protein [Microbacteriaceae bacterium]
MTAVLRSEASGDFDVLVLDSHANRNALSLQLLGELTKGIVVSAGRPSRGLVITHTGTTFCSGVDLRERQALGKTDDAHSRLLGELFVALWNYPKPVVIALDGAVRGGGMGLLACGDVVVASADSTFAYSEARVGVAPALVMAVTLVTVTHRGILPWLLSGAVFTSDEALALGLVTGLDGAPRTAGIQTAVAGLTAASPLAQLSTKRLFRAAHNVDLSASIGAMTAESAAQFASVDAEEGLAAFAQKRPPRWMRAAGTAASDSTQATG